MRYFAYGSNMDSNQMRERKVSFSGMQRAILKKHSLQFNKMASANPTKEGKGNIVDADDFVEGVLYDITDSDRDKLDKFEGYPKEYDRMDVLVQLSDGSEVEGFTYVAQSYRVRNNLKPTKEYLSHYLAACDLLSSEYYQKLKSWPTLD